MGDVIQLELRRPKDEIDESLESMMSKALLRSLTNTAEVDRKDIADYVVRLSLEEIEKVRLSCAFTLQPSVEVSTEREMEIVRITLEQTASQVQTQLQAIYAVARRSLFRVAHNSTVSTAALVKAS